MGVEGLRWAEQRFPDRPVIYVPGNHEFYHHDLALIEDLKLQAPDHIHVLNDDQVIIDGVRFLGSILWTDFALFGEGEQFYAMKTARRGMTISPSSGMMGGNLLHRTPPGCTRPAGAGWLAESFDGRTVVVTHHAPSPRSVHPRYARDLLTPAFASNLEMLMDGGRAALWAHGHMHDAFDYEINGTRVVCNPRGYAPRDLNSYFLPDLVMEI